MQAAPQWHESDLIRSDVLQRVIRMKELVHIVGLRRSAIYNMVRSGRFPRQVLIGQRAVAWREGDVEAWIADRPVKECTRLDQPRS